MRMLMHVSLPCETFNAAVKDGSVGKKIERILAELKPEAAYFTEREGERGAYLIVEVKNPAAIPAFAEPWFLTFNSRVEFRIVLSPADLEQSGLDELGKKWAHP